MSDRAEAACGAAPDPAEGTSALLPAWLRETEHFSPASDGRAYIFRTMRALGGVLSRIQVQRGHEKERSLPALLKFLFLIALLLLISVSRSRLVLLSAAAGILVCLCFWPGRDILRILKAPLFAGALTALLLIPAFLAQPAALGNDVTLVCKVILCVLAVNIFNHTTQWNHITAALRRLHIPGVVIFLIDLTLKYIVLLGGLLAELLTALELRSVGRNERKYASVGGVLGVTFVRSTELSRETVEAMRCRCFTDDYGRL